MKEGSSKVTDRTYFAKDDLSKNYLTGILRGRYVKNLFSILMNAILKLNRKIISKSDDGSVVVIAFARLGDTVFGIPAIKKITEFYPADRIKVICYPESEVILKLAELNIDIYTVGKENFLFNRRIANGYSRKVLKETDPSVIYDLTGTVLSASLIFNSRAAVIYGSNEIFFHSIYSKLCGVRTTPHLIDRYLDVAALSHSFERPNEIYVHEVKLNPDGYILVHPLAIRKAKEWNLNKYLQLCTGIMQDYEVKLVIPADSLDDDIIAEIRAMAIPLVITSLIDELIEAIKGCSIYISNDTGPLYIANLTGKPTFTIYGPTNPAYSRPFGEYHRIINRQVPCSPVTGQTCYTLAGIYCNHYQCMNLLDTSTVLNEVRKFIEELGITRMKNHHRAVL
jgi:ADP-heptose:LPS heptosyltransferase